MFSLQTYKHYSSEIQKKRIYNFQFFQFSTIGIYIFRILYAYL